MEKCPKCGSVSGVLQPNIISAKAKKLLLKCRTCGNMFEQKESI